MLDLSAAGSWIPSSLSEDRRRGQYLKSTENWLVVDQGRKAERNRAAQC